MPNRNVVVVGASTGGGEALTSLLSRLPADFPAGVCVVLHISEGSPATLSDFLSRRCALPVSTARDGEPFGQGHVYLAPPDHHLLLKRGQLRVVMGPRENRVRPAIDPLFRSAGVAYGSSVIGVVLTGLLNDGSAGLAAIKRCGGLAVVQDPADAPFPDMPLNARRAAEVDHCLTLEAMPDLLNRLVREEAAANPLPPGDIVLEVDIAERIMSDVSREETLGHPAPFGCPGCGGPLWEMEDTAVKRYRCHVGHGYTAETLLADQSDAVEKALWVALRTLEERANMLRRMADDERTRNRSSVDRLYTSRAEEAEGQASSVRNLLLGGLQAAQAGALAPPTASDLSA